MDAMVFFAIAMLLSSAAIAHTRNLSDVGEVTGHELIDPAELLSVVLHASICTRFDLMTEPSVAISGEEKVAAVIAAEVVLWRSGMNLAVFEEPNSRIHRMLISVCGPSYCALLRIVDDPFGSPAIVVEIGEIGSEPETVLASCVELPVDAGPTFLVSLALAPVLPVLPQVV